jgi:hypothetical protein
MGDDDLCDDFEAAYRIGTKIIEAAERVAEMHKIVPGSRATWGFTIDGVRFETVITVGERGDG